MFCWTAALSLYCSMQCPPNVLHLVHGRGEWWAVPLFLNSCLILFARKMCTEFLTGFVKEVPVLCNMMEADCIGSKEKS